jgi:hypothetical protein
VAVIGAPQGITDPVEVAERMKLCAKLSGKPVLAVLDGRLEYRPR